MLLSLLLIVCLAGLLSTANTQCCLEPTFELSSVKGRALIEIPNGQTVTKFQQTVGDTLGDIFNGDLVNEGSGYAGTDGCWYPGAPFPSTSVVSGGSWTVGSNFGFAINGTNQWGYDFDGDASDIVADVRKNAKLPCTDHTPQTMYFASSCVGAYPYYSNVQTVTITSTTVSNCRGGICDTFNY
jgi:hypothetical protein